MQHEWHSFLDSQGAQWRADSLDGFDHTSASCPPERFIAPMTEHVLLVASGANTHQFLQGQLTCDMRQIAEGRHSDGAHCTAQGRMISSFRVFPLAGDGVALRLPLDNAENALAALCKYAAFSRVTLKQVPWHGLFIGAPPSAEQFPSPGCSEAGENHLVARHNDGSIEVWGTPDFLIAHWQQFANSLHPQGPAAYRFWQIRMGLTEVHAATSGEFIPQQFNFDLTGAISFDKGCYTGQEVIARVHYRGQTKKRTRRAWVEPVQSQLAVGGTVQLEDKVVGAVIEHATGYGKQAALVCLNNNAMHHGTLYQTGNQTVNFLWNELPYAIPNE